MTLALTSCGNKTIENHNDTIVLAHNELIKIDESLSNGLTKYFGKPELKEDLKKFLSEKREQLIAGRKPVENLADFKDSNMKEYCLDLFDRYESLLLTMNLKVDVITGPNANFEMVSMFINEFEKIDEAEKDLKEAQLRYASNNNVQLR